MTAVPPSYAPPAAPRRPSWGFRLQQAPVTFGLIGVTVAVFILQYLSSGFASATSLPCGLRTNDLVQALGAKDSLLILQGQFWRFVTPIFIHAGLLHIGVNMYSLFALGPPLERFFGPPRYLAVYLLSGVSGVVFSMVFSPACSVGASGAIFGLLGALAMFLYLHRHVFGPGAGIMLRQLIIVGALNLIYGAANPGIDLWGHIGGVLAGAACAALFGPRLVREDLLGMPTRLSDQRPWPEVWPRVGMAVLGIAALALAGMVVAARG